MKTAEIIKSFTDISTGKEELERVLANATEEEVIAIIIGINEGERYWTTEQKRMQNPRPNMGPYRSPSYSMYTFDVYGKERIFEPFAAFLLKVVKAFPHLALYVHDGEFGFSPVFAVRQLNVELKSPYLVKFKEHHFPENLYGEMIKTLYSDESKQKHAAFGLKKISSLESYEY